MLKSFPPDVKKRLYLVHVAAKDVPPDSGLKIAQPGLENSILLDVESIPEEKVYDKLDLIASIDLFNELPIKKFRDLMRSTYEELYLPGQFLIREGSFGEKFYIISHGIVKIYNDSFNQYGFVTDYFGEAALTTKSKRNAKYSIPFFSFWLILCLSVVAVSNVTVLVLDRLDFLFIFGLHAAGDQQILNKFENLAAIRKSPILSVLNKYLLFISRLEDSIHVVLIDAETPA